MKFVMLIDGNNYMYRAHFASKLLETREGFPTSVLHGALQMLLTLYRKWNPDAVVFCWDGDGDGWRKRLAPKLYKANRQKHHELVFDERSKMFRQLPILRKILNTLCFKQVCVDGVEADDVLGVLSLALTKKGYGVILHSSDKDLYQLVGERVQILKKSDGPLLDRKAIETEIGVLLEDWREVRALIGDVSDSVPGLKGVGPFTAPKLWAAGMDPKKNWEGLRSPARTKYVKFREYWPIAQLGYVLGRIPREANDSAFTDTQKLALVEAIKGVVRNPARELRYSKSMQEEFLRFLGKYELAVLTAQRNKFWQLP